MGWFELLLSISLIAGWQNSFAGSVSASSISHLGEGSPGCWKWIRGGALTPEEEYRLPKECSNMRNDYFVALDLASTKPHELQKKISTVLKNAKSPKTPYEAIFFATVIRTPDTIAAINTRAKYEKKAKLAFQYAVVAQSIVNAKDKEKGCTEAQDRAGSVYQELCEAHDSILSAYFPAKGASK